MNSECKSEMGSYRLFCIIRLIYRWKPVAHLLTWLHFQCKIISFKLKYNGNKQFHILDTMVFVFKLNWFKCQAACFNCRALSLYTASSLNSGNLFCYYSWTSLFFTSIYCHFLYCIWDGLRSSSRAKNIVKFLAQ